MNQKVYTQASKSSPIGDNDFWVELPGHVKRGIEKSLEQTKNGQTKTYAEVKNILAKR